MSWVKSIGIAALVVVCVIFITVLLAAYPVYAYGFLIVLIIALIIMVIATDLHDGSSK